ncbi:hypothetical protein GGI24_002232 [Coemansia furcata]|nr:hypothetical protein GGI24_002232 [Coemansia furcata]
MVEDVIQQQQQWAMLDDDMVAVQSWMWQHLQHNDWLLVDDFEDDDDVLPLYGKSDDEGKYSDSLLHEIIKQECIAKVQQIMQQWLAVFSDEWQAKQQPQLELHASSFWHSNVANCICLKMLLVKLVNECLPKIQHAMIDSGEVHRNKIVSQCKSLHVTANQISKIKWLLKLTSRLRPLPLRASSMLPGLLSHRNHSDCHARPACGGSDIDDNNLSDDSMDDFIDDDDDVAPVGSMDGNSSAMSSRCLVSMMPSVDASAFAAELAHHLPDAMYLAAIDCIQKMAQRATLFGAVPPFGVDPAPKDMAPAIIALQMWSEFQCWIHSVWPMVTVQYANFQSCNKVKRQMDHLLAKQQAGANMEISIRLLQQWVPK